MDAITSFVSQWLWPGALAVVPMAAAVAVVCRVVRCRPATRFALWALVLLWLAAPAILPQPPRVQPRQVAVGIVDAGRSLHSAGAAAIDYVVASARRFSARIDGIDPLAKRAEVPRFDPPHTPLMRPRVVANRTGPGAAALDGSNATRSTRGSHADARRPFEAPSIALLAWADRRLSILMETSAAPRRAKTIPTPPWTVGRCLGALPKWLASVSCHTGPLSPFPALAWAAPQLAREAVASLRLDGLHEPSRLVAEHRGRWVDGVSRGDPGASAEDASQNYEQFLPQMALSGDLNVSDPLRSARPVWAAGPALLGELAVEPAAMVEPLLPTRSELAARWDSVAGTLAPWGNAAAALRDGWVGLPPLPGSIWVGGIVVILLIHGVQIARIRRRFGAGQPAPADVVAAVRRLSRRIGLSQPPQVCMVRGRWSPMVWCGRRTRLILPQALWEQLDEVGREAVLCHELAHLKRGDQWMHRVELLVGLLYWWHPVVWWVRRRLREEAELCCDAWVTWLMPKNRRSYAEALLAARSYCDGGDPVPRLGIGATSGRARRLARRIQMVMTENTRPRLSIAGLVAMLALAATGWVSTPALSCPRADEKGCKEIQSTCEAAPAPRAHGHVHATAGQLLRSTAAAPGHVAPATPRDLHERVAALEQRIAELSGAPAPLPMPQAFSATGALLGPAIMGAVDQPTLFAPPAAGPPVGWAMGGVTPAPGSPVAVWSGAFGAGPNRGGDEVCRYSMPKAKRDALLKLMVRDDVPVRVRPTENGIEVHAPASEQAVVRAFVELVLDSNDHEKVYRISKSKSKDLAALMSRDDVHVKVRPDDDTITVYATEAEHAAFKAFRNLIDPGSSRGGAVGTPPLPPQPGIVATPRAPRAPRAPRHAVRPVAPRDADEDDDDDDDDDDADDEDDEDDADEEGDDDDSVSIGGAAGHGRSHARGHAQAAIARDASRQRRALEQQVRGLERQAAELERSAGRMEHGHAEHKDKQREAEAHRRKAEQLRRGAEAQRREMMRSHKHSQVMSEHLADVHRELADLRGQLSADLPRIIHESLAGIEAAELHGADGAAIRKQIREAMEQARGQIGPEIEQALKQAGEAMHGAAGSIAAGDHAARAALELSLQSLHHEVHEKVHESLSKAAEELRRAAKAAKAARKQVYDGDDDGPRVEAAQEALEQAAERLENEAAEQIDSGLEQAGEQIESALDRWEEIGTALVDAGELGDRSVIINTDDDEPPADDGDAAEVAEIDVDDSDDDAPAAASDSTDDAEDDDDEDDDDDDSADGAK